MINRSGVSFFFVFFKETWKVAASALCYWFAACTLQGIVSLQELQLCFDSQQWPSPIHCCCEQSHSSCNGLQFIPGEVGEREEGKSLHIVWQHESCLINLGLPQKHFWKGLKLERQILG